MKTIVICNYDDYGDIYDILLVKNKDFKKALEIMSKNNNNAYDKLFKSLEKNNIKYKLVSDFEYFRR